MYSNRAYQWKMHPDPKQEQMMLSFLGNHTLQSLSITTLSLHVLIKSTQVLSLIPNQTLAFILKKSCDKVIGLIRRLSVSLPREALLTIHKSSARPHLHCVDILFDKPGNLSFESFESKIEKVHYKACIAIIVGLISISKRRCYKKLTFYHKIVNRLLPD